MKLSGMTPFEYVITLISIILGMGITQIVTGVADMVHHWDKVKVYWPHVLWIILVFILHIQEWWSTYALRNFMSFELPTFLFILLYPINLFILARILFPMTEPGGDVDMKKFYDGNFRKFFLWSSFLPAISFLNNLLILRLSFVSQLGHIILFTVFMVLLAKKHLSETAHKILAVVLLASTIAILGTMWNQLS